jgi:hypothetical protein
MHRANPAALGLLCFLLVILPIALWIAALILKAAVWLTNTVTGGSPPTEAGFYEPGSVAGGQASSLRPNRAVPIPIVGKGMVIEFAIAVANYLLLVALSLANGAGAGLHHSPALRGQLASSPEAQLSALIALVVSFAAQSILLATLLPTSIGRASLIVVIRWGATLFLIVAIFVAIAALPALRFH